MQQTRCRIDQLTCRAAQDLISQQRFPIPVGDMSLFPINLSKLPFLKSHLLSFCMQKPD